MLSPTHQTASKYSSSSPSIQVISEVKKNGTNSPATLKSKVHPTLVQHRAINHRKDRQSSTDRLTVPNGEHSEYIFRKQTLSSIPEDFTHFRAKISPGTVSYVIVKANKK
ncbi:hypothetical protein PO909_025421 [Leuciscus waleckii]